MNVAVPEVCGKVRQSALGIDSLTVPLSHSVNDKRVT